MRHLKANNEQFNGLFGCSEIGLSCLIKFFNDLRVFVCA